MLEEIKAELGSNYTEATDAMIQDLLDEVTTNALFISNRENTAENIAKLSYEIKQCVKSLYLLRGSEDVTSRSESGVSSTYTNAYETMRNNIIKNGKRIFI